MRLRQETKFFVNMTDFTNTDWFAEQDMIPSNDCMVHWGLDDYTKEDLAEMPEEIADFVRYARGCTDHVILEICW